jgi:hypothetical protein
MLLKYQEKRFHLQIMQYKKYCRHGCWLSISWQKSKICSPATIANLKKHPGFDAENIMIKQISRNHSIYLTCLMHTLLK